MSTPLVASPATEKMRLPALRIVTIAGLIANVVIFVVLQALILRTLIVELSIILALTLVIAGICATRWRWAPHLVIAWAIISVVPGLEPYSYDLTHPAEFGTFLGDLMGLVALLIAVVASISEIVIRRQQAAEQPLPSWFRSFLVGMTMFVLGCGLVGLIPANSTTAGVNPAALAQLPGVVADRNSFDQSEIRARAGETVALRLENNDTMVHQFDIDAFNVHVSMPTGSPALALFTPTTPGSYQFYCRIPGHTEAGMKGTLIVEP